MNAAYDESALRARAGRIRDTSLVWDMVWPIAPEVGNSYETLARFAAAGFDLVSITLAGDAHSAAEAFHIVARARAEIAARADRLHLVTDSADIESAYRAGKLAVLMHFEGTRCFGRDIDTIAAFAALGVRFTLLAFNQANSVGGGCAEIQDGGLTRFGRRVVREMQRVGMLVDLSHTGHKTSLDAMAMAQKPVIFSHSNAAAIAPHFRNLSDEQIRGCAQTGGVVGISGSSEYLGVKEPSAEAIFRHIDYLVQRVGIQHVGLGLDIVFDTDALNSIIRARPDEWPQTQNPDWAGFRYIVPEALLGVIECMLRAGYSETDIRAVLGANFQRVCAAAWKA